MKIYSMAIYLSSGNVIRGRYKKFTFTSAKDGKVENLDCKSYGAPALNMVDVTTIVALVCEGEEEVSDE